YEEPNYLEALAESMQPYLQQDFDHLLFSYHGVPERHIHKGDITGNHCLKVGNCCEADSPAHQYCYRHQCRITSKKVAALLNIPEGRWSMSFQSRLGRDE